jgi:hypothetical protein
MTRQAESLIEAVVAEADFGTASARKGGRHPKWPYVPVIVYDDGRGDERQRTSQVIGRAYATRDEAVASAQRQIDHMRARLGVKLRNPRLRALREQYGLPRELADVGVSA